MKHHDAMRTTVTLDADVGKLLRDAMRRSGRPFKKVLNDAVRSGLSRARSGQVARFRQPVFDLGAPLVDLTKAATLAAELEDQETVAKYRRRNVAARP